MKPCIHRQDYTKDRFICLNTVDIIHSGTVSKLICETCPYATESPTRGLGDVVAGITKATGIKSIVDKVFNNCGCSERQDLMNSFTPTARSIENGRWAVVVTTAPRPNPTFTCCIESIRKAGWEPTVFAEPGSIEIPNLSYRWNKERLGVWHNWLTSIRWAYDTGAEFILTVQDDSLFHPDSRSFVESILWPSYRTGFISLYTPKHYSFDKSGGAKPTGVNKIITSSLWGACALVFHRNVIKLILDNDFTKTWTGVPPRSQTVAERKAAIQRRKDNPHTIQNSDTAIGKLMILLKHDMYFIDPSPVKHISTHSSISHGSNDGRRNCFRCADHTIPLLQQVFPHLKDKQ